jgi:hypothetical protein
MRKLQLASVGELVRLWEALPSDVRDRVAAHVRPVGEFIHVAHRAALATPRRVVVSMTGSRREICG